MIILWSLDSTNFFLFYCKIIPHPYERGVDKASVIPHPTTIRRGRIWANIESSKNLRLLFFNCLNFDIIKNITENQNNFQFVSIHRFEVWRKRSMQIPIGRKFTCNNIVVLWIALDILNRISAIKRKQSKEFERILRKSDEYIGQ